MQLQGEDSPNLVRWLDSHKYMSYEIVNEMILLMVKALLWNILVGIREAQW